MKVLYFAWIRERAGISQEDLTLPKDVHTLEDFLHWMRGRSEGLALALQSEASVRVALDQEHCNDLKTPLTNVSEIALFPPMTGG